MLDGVLRERPSELFILSIATMVIIVYLIINYVLAEVKGDIKLARMVSACSLGELISIITISMKETKHPQCILHSCSIVETDAFKQKNEIK